jgi:hypothetical protein
MPMYIHNSNHKLILFSFTLFNSFMSSSTPVQKVLICNKLFCGLQLKQQKIQELESLQHSLQTELDILLVLLKDSFHSLLTSKNNSVDIQKILSVLQESNITFNTLGSIIDLLGKSLTPITPTVLEEQKL